MERVAEFVNDKSTYNYDELISSIKFKQEEIIEVEKVTRGQSDNKKWSEFWQGMITASNLRRFTVAEILLIQQPLLNT